jgi:hypothetical protein
VTADALRCSAASVIWRVVTPWTPTSGEQALGFVEQAFAGGDGGGATPDALG